MNNSLNERISYPFEELQKLIDHYKEKCMSYLQYISRQELDLNSLVGLHNQDQELIQRFVLIIINHICCNHLYFYVYC